MFVAVEGGDPRSQGTVIVLHTAQQTYGAILLPRICQPLLRLTVVLWLPLAFFILALMFPFHNCAECTPNKQ